jgi:hypothetical protein
MAISVSNTSLSRRSSNVQTDTSSLGQVVGTAQIEELPLNGRDYIQLATLSTGVVRTSSGTNGNSGGSSTGGQNSFVANGTRGTLNNFLLDGIDNNSNDNGGVVLRTNVDAIQEFKIQTNSYSAEFGRSGGAVVNAIIKSGTNRYHGNLFEFFRNSALDARDCFEPVWRGKGFLQAESIWGTFGGPARQDKLFFFGDYQDKHSQSAGLAIQGAVDCGTEREFFRSLGTDHLRSRDRFAVPRKRDPFGPNRPNRPSFHESLS